MPCRPAAHLLPFALAALLATSCAEGTGSAAPAPAPAPAATAPATAAVNQHLFDFGGAKIVVPLDRRFLPASVRAPRAFAVTQAGMHPGLKLAQLFHTEENFRRLEAGETAQGGFLIVSIGRGMEDEAMTAGEFAALIADSEAAIAANARRQATPAENDARAERLGDAAGEPLRMDLRAPGDEAVYRRDARTLRTRSWGHVSFRSGEGELARQFEIDVGSLSASVLAQGRSFGLQWQFAPYSPQAMAEAQVEFDRVVEAVVAANEAETGERAN